MNSQKVKEKPILFNTAMVQAILTCKKCGQISNTFPCCHCGGVDFLKTQTRRVVKQLDAKYDYENEKVSESEFFIFRSKKTDDVFFLKCPHGQAGDQLWVRETFACGMSSSDGMAWKATSKYDDFEDGTPENFSEIKWKPSIHMPKIYARIWLEVVNVSVERLHDIDVNDIISEGIIPPTVSGMFSEDDFHDILMEKFIDLWDAINKKRGYSWDSNPYVWREEFKIIEVKQ